MLVVTSSSRFVMKTKLLLHNRKLYLAYGMVLCLVTLTDLQMRRAGLSASAELLIQEPCRGSFYNNRIVCILRITKLN